MSSSLIAGINSELWKAIPSSRKAGAVPVPSAQTQELADYIAAGRHQRLPDEVIGKASAHVLDTVAAMVSGARLEPGRRAAAYAAAENATGAATVIGTGTTTSPTVAAVANGMSAHADETDDSHAESLSHPGCAVVPAALAVAESRSLSGRDLVNAVVVGYDVGTRVVLAAGRPPVLAATSSYSTHAYVGEFGAAAAACVLHGFDERAVRHALSYAAQSASGVTTWLRDGNHVEKSFVFAGMPAGNGVRAAALVAAGCDGVDDVFAFEPNFLDAVSDRTDRARLTAGLGTRYEVLHTNIKRYAVGSPAQAAVQATEDLIASDDPAAADVAEIEIVLPHDLAGVVDSRDMPDINVQYLVAGTLVDRGFSFAMAHDPSRMAEPAIRELVGKTKLVADPAVSEVRTATVILRMADGRQPRRHVSAVRGTTDDPMSHAELVDKCLDLIEPVLGAARAREVIDVVTSLDELADVRTLGRLVG